MDRAAPLLCADVTMYSPLIHWKAGPGKRVGIVGLGGLGHIGVKIAQEKQLIQQQSPMDSKGDMDNNGSTK